MIAFALMLRHLKAIVDLNFSLSPPHKLTGPTEIGQWSLRGSALNMKQYIRLSDNLKNNFGAICQKSKTKYHEWRIELELRAYGGKGGKGFWFYYTKEKCPIFAVQFTGICIWINTTSTDANGYSDVYYVENRNLPINPKSIYPIGKIKIRKNRSSSFIIIQKRNQTISLFIKNVAEPIFSKKLRKNSKFGYFTISAMGSDNADCHDLVSVKTSFLSLHDAFVQKNDDMNLIVKEKKSDKETGEIDDDDVEEELSVTDKYAILAQKLELSGEKQKLSDSFIIVKEAHDRSLSTITLQALSNFIDNLIEPSISTAYDKMSNTRDFFSEFRTEIVTILENLTSNLRTLSIEVNNSLEEIQKSTFATVQQVRDKEINVQNLKKQLKQAARAVTEATIPHILFAIACIELALYLLFFWSKYKKYSRKFD